MEIITFNNAHIDAAQRIAHTCYDRERTAGSRLPLALARPDLSEFSNGGLSVVAIQDGVMLGFLCAYPGFENAFGTTGVKGTFSPIHAHGVINVDNSSVYARLYEAAARRWVDAGIISHAVSLYAHDRYAMEIFFRYGFGMRLVEAVKPVTVMSCSVGDGLCFRELDKEEAISLHGLVEGLSAHLSESPIFLKYSVSFSKEYWAEMIDKMDARYFAVFDQGCAVAYIRIGAAGENFASEDAAMMNIIGAYCLPEYRGKGLYGNLLAYANNCLLKEGYSYLGVDFESANPTAWGFWIKHFTPYIVTVVRRIDENILC